MADLQQVVGAILRDLAKARFASDLYSRSIARYYENDYLLRKFPVPRSDIEEVEVELKFSISEVLASQVNAEGREANVAFLLERSVEMLVATYLDLARKFTADPKNEAHANALRELLSKGFNSVSLRIELRQKILRYFIESYTHLIGSDGTFKSDLALEELRRPIFWGLAAFLHDPELREQREQLNEPSNAVFDYVSRDDDFANVVKELAGPIRNIWENNYDARLEVEIEGSKLAQLSDAAISTVRIKAVVRNLVWSEVKLGEHKSRQVLTSD